MSSPLTGFGSNASVGSSGGGSSIEVITASKTLTAADNNKVFVNEGATNIVLTWPADATLFDGVPVIADFNVAGQMLSTGTIQIAAGTGVTQIGNANVTALEPQYVYCQRNGVDTCDVKVG